MTTDYRSVTFSDVIETPEQYLILIKKFLEIFCDFFG